MKKLSDCRVLLVDDAKANLDILVEGLKPDHKLSLALNGNKHGGVFLTHSGKSLFRIANVLQKPSRSRDAVRCRGTPFTNCDGLFRPGRFRLPFVLF